MATDAPLHLSVDARLQRLVDAVLTVASDVDLATVLRRIVEAAVELVDARYGALGVIGDDRFLSQFIYVGVDAETADAIGHLPEGHGILGLLIHEPHPLRLPELAEHAASYGFPAHHPPMHSFLGVPIRVGGRVYGNLYLTEKRGGEEFSPEDEELALALAAVAGAAIAHAHLYEDQRRGHLWRSAVLRVTSDLLAGAEPDHVAATVAAAARELVAGDAATVALPLASGDIAVIAADGEEAARIVGGPVPLQGALTGAATSTGGSARIDDITTDARARHHPITTLGVFGPAIVVPLSAGGDAVGSLLVARTKGASAFAAHEEELLRLFADHASVAIVHSSAQEELRRLSVLSDRERIGRDLHDTVIQRLFATGLGLQSTARRVEAQPEIAGRIAAAVEALDDTIREIRGTIFALQIDTETATGVRAELLRLAAELAPALGVRPHARFIGAVDAAVDAATAEHLLAVAREGLTNVARHAKAATVSLSVMVADDDIVLTISDDGVGVSGGGSGGGLGIGNMEWRAQLLGGTLELRPGEPTGTQLEWRVPRR